MNELIVFNKKVENSLTHYRTMCAAIFACANVDDCAKIADEAVAVAAYYSQIRDTETVNKLYEVKLRAWRRIAELFSKVDLAEIEKMDVPKYKIEELKVKKIRSHFTDQAVGDMRDGRILEILKLGKLSTSDFEFAISGAAADGMVTTISALLRYSPEAQEKRKQLEIETKKRHEAWEKDRPRREKEERELEKIKQQEHEKAIKINAERRGTYCRIKNGFQ
jgi:hypothetical protein